MTDPGIASDEGADAPTPGPTPGRARRVVTAVALVTASTLALVGGVALQAAVVPGIIAALVPPDDPRVLGAQTAIIDAVLEQNAELDARLDEATDAYRTRVETWQSFEASAASWRGRADAAPPGAPNPGGDAMPGGDPTGRGLLDSIGAGDVVVAFDSSANNCGYASIASDGVYSLAVGGCYNSAYRNTLFIAWDPGTESAVWPIFVHEAMHWYQAQHHYELYFATQEAGVDPAVWSERLEVDASCRAVFQHGIPIEDFEGTSAPCTALDWHDGWLVEQAAALGAMVVEPDPESFEVLEVVRP